MHITVIGAAGRTGRLVLEAASHAGHEVAALVRDRGAALPARVARHVGDALELDAVRDALRACDAVISTIGPSERSPADLSSRSARVLVDAMRAEGVSRASLVTGAMSGDADHLGVFYRTLRRAPPLKALVADRALEEELLLGSGLSVTILRPPRLTDDGPSEGGPEVGDELTVHMLDRCSRADLARALLEAVERPPAEARAVYVRSR